MQVVRIDMRSPFSRLNFVRLRASLLARDAKHFCGRFWQASVSLVFGAFACLILETIVSAQGAAPPLISPGTNNQRPDRFNLLTYRDAQHQEKPVHNTKQWLIRRAQIVDGFLEITGPIPGASKVVPLELRIEEETDCGDYLRRFITYTSEPGSRVPAYLLVPKPFLSGTKKAPAVLALHQTHGLGHKVVVGLGKSPDDEYGVELVKKGYVVMAPAYPLLANYAPNWRAMGYSSATMKAVWDNKRGLDLLETLPYVKKGMFGAIGHSLGGHNGVFTAVLDLRIKVVVTSCGLDSFLDYMGGEVKGWSGDRYMPRMSNYGLRDIPFDFPELIAALAPRPVFISSPYGDTNFRWESVDRVASAARQIYGLYRKPEHLVVMHPDCGHRFPREMRERAYEILKKVLRPRKLD